MKKNKMNAEIILFRELVDITCDICTLKGELLRKTSLLNWLLVVVSFSMH